MTGDGRDGRWLTGREECNRANAADPAAGRNFIAAL